ncbi:MAG TPA: hypothetical protein PLG23_08685 [Thermoflexales bacterium]|jgi:hypothetical protein|nr:hypothetical protein [Anaerolineae bacterium]HQV28151.1 hypothetical protein [Thermoflexales bacterium]HQX10055.1 hypothetical protein [Thermoflexales bacterium]HQY24114.1 hypothetical protein [Thermoflexales bacterium]HQZ53528.1 hypothetical protein [Thermoflexales bacterium]
MDKFIKTSAIALIIFAVVLAFVVGTRMEQATIVLLSGAAVGILLCAPCAAFITFAAMKRREGAPRDERLQRYTAPLPQEPPTYWSLPSGPFMVDARRFAPGLPAGNAGYADAGYAMPARRKFYVIGESGEVRDADGGDDS